MEIAINAAAASWQHPPKCGRCTWGTGAHHEVGSLSRKRHTQCVGKQPKGHRGTHWGNSGTQGTPEAAGGGGLRAYTDEGNNEGSAKAQTERLEDTAQHTKLEGLTNTNTLPSPLLSPFFHSRLPLFSLYFSSPSALLSLCFRSPLLSHSLFTLRPLSFRSSFTLLSLSFLCLLARHSLSFHFAFALPSLFFFLNFSFTCPSALLSLSSPSPFSVF
jgi:hypothetical protein